MSEWTEVKLSDISKVQTGPFGSQLKNEQYITNGTPVVTVEHIRNFRIIDFNYPSVKKEDKIRLSKYLLIAGDILFTRVGSVDLSAFVKPHQAGWMFSSRMLRVRPKNEVNPRFLSYYFQLSKFREHLLSIAVGATMPSINTEILESVPILLPPLPEQRTIASVLSSLDDKIDLLHCQNKTLEAMAETLFRQWFVEEVKEDWEEGFLGDIVEFNYGKTLKEQERSSFGFPVYGSNGIIGYHSTFLVEAPGIITGRKGTLGMVHYSFENFYPIDTTFYITSKFKSDCLHYEYFLLKSMNLIEMNTDSAVPGLNKNLAHGIQITIPPIHLVITFNILVKPFFEKIKINKSQIRTLSALRDTLLPKLMSREVRVELNND